MAGTQWVKSTEKETGQVGRGKPTKTYVTDACICIKSFHFYST